MAISLLYSKTTPTRKSDNRATWPLCKDIIAGFAAVAARWRGHAYACSLKIQAVHSPSLKEIFTQPLSKCRLGRASTSKTCPFCKSHHGALDAGTFKIFGASQLGICACCHSVRRCLEAVGTKSRSPLARVFRSHVVSNTVGMIVRIAGWFHVVNCITSYVQKSFVVQKWHLVSCGFLRGHCSIPHERNIRAASRY